VSVCRDDDCVISPNRATAQCTPPACVDRERLCERLFCELACLAANLNGRIDSDPKICGLLRDAVCVNSLFFWRVYKVEPKNQLRLVWQSDVERIAVVPPLRLIGAAVEPLERLSGWGVLREREHWNNDKEREQSERFASHSTTPLSGCPLVRKIFRRANVHAP
jgi:hypothetical protein